MNEEENVVELDEINIIMRIPKDAATLDVTAHILGNDMKVTNATKHLTTDDVRSAREAFLENVEAGDDYDATYVLTDEGRRYLEMLEAGKNDK